MVKGFEIAFTAVVGERIAFLVVFQDGKDALYLASLQKVPLAGR